MPYNADAVNAAIRTSRKPIGKREAKAIHAVLGGWRAARAAPCTTKENDQ